MTDNFWTDVDFIDTYTIEDAIADGTKYEVTHLVDNPPMRILLTQSLYLYLNPNDLDEIGESLSGRFWGAWNIFLLFARANPNTDRMPPKKMTVRKAGVNQTIEITAQLIFDIDGTVFLQFDGRTE